MAVVTYRIPADDEMKIGARYRVQLEDCCIVGHFVSELVSIDDGVLVFGNGVTLEEFSQGAMTREDS